VRMPRRNWLVGAVVVMTLALAAGPGPARAEPESGDFAGQVVVSDVLLAPGVTSAALRRFQRSAIQAVGGFWRLHMVAFLDRAAEGEAVALTAYDVTAAGERKQVRVFEVPVELGARTVQLNDFVISEALGFARGHKFELDIGPAGDAGGKPGPYAKGSVTLR
jgi:hypothetical protein